ncbi:PilZ domain-containing protein [Sphingomonas sp. TDK1]|uniref:PilZ domain-containing protein n=1 Tax=Sphingomonas sp. TDK1 TaxID=453247 RepID=UPI0007D94763|nr:PilZ domain-containing protein [Sphingomonas sp. TDK1]OAN60187.1 pilZ domain protein [Sphingomonas sp. TDK1]
MDQQSYIPTNTLSADDFAGKRSGVRDSLLLTAQFRVDAEDAGTVRVRNLSAGGLMAEYAAPVSLRTPVEVEVRGVGWVKGKIAWAAEGRVGVAFDHEIDPKLARKPVGGGTRTPDYVKPILTRR